MKTTEGRKYCRVCGRRMEECHGNLVPCCALSKEQNGDGLVMADGPEGGVYPAPAGAVNLEFVQQKDAVALLDLLMSEFDGVVDEWDLLCHLPWGTLRYGQALGHPLLFWRESYQDRGGVVRTRVFVTDNGFDAWLAQHGPGIARGRKEKLAGLRQG